MTLGSRRKAMEKTGLAMTTNVSQPHFELRISKMTGSGMRIPRKSNSGKTVVMEWGI